MGVERSGPESEESDRRGATNSAGPITRLGRSVNEQREVAGSYPLRWLREHSRFLQRQSGITDHKFLELVQEIHRLLSLGWGESLSKI